MAQAPTESKKVDSSTQTQYKIEDIYDIKKEQELLKLYVDVALEARDETWKQHKTKDAAIKVDYKYLPNDNLCTIRGETIIKDCTIDDYYNFTEGGFNDVYEWEKLCDKMCTENRAVKVIDIDHDVVYGSYDSGLFVISPRDFCYIKSRQKLLNYRAADGELYDVSCTLCYSINEKHPFYVKTKNKHVRATLKYSGYIFVKNKSDATSCRVFYIVYLDPCGWIPTWVVNLVAPDQGMVIKSMLKLWPKAREFLEKRKENNYKKDNEIMFDKPQQYKPITNNNDDDDTKNDDNKADDDKKENVVAGGWKEAEKEEIIEVANAVKDKVEEQAKNMQQEAFKIYQPISGAKQVVAGMNYKIKIQIGDDRFCEIHVYKSLPPVDYKLKRVTW